MNMPLSDAQDAGTDAGADAVEVQDVLLLIPQPQHVWTNGDTVALPREVVVRLQTLPAITLLFPAQELVRALVDAGSSASMIATADPAWLAERFTITLSIVPGSTAQREGYELHITPTAIDAIAADAAGIFYAVQTLRQLLAAYGLSLPVAHVRDHPDFPNRGVMLDISRDKVPSMETLYLLVDRFAALKFNQLQLYTEHTFAYSAHADVWAEASPMTPAQVLALDAYCRARFVELVPNQNTFGHMRRWLTLPAYKHLAEAPDGCMTRWGWFDEPFSLNPGDPASLALVVEMLDELLPHFSSAQVNVGLDETVDLGEGRSRKAVQEQGIGAVFLEFLLKVYREVKRRGRTMQYWGDIIMEHPELTAQLPRDAVALEWGYEANHPFAAHGARYAAAGIPFYVCPGTSSWNTVAGRTDNALENMRSAAHNGLAHGAVGYLVTDWGDNGHWQPLAVSLAPFAFAAGQAWSHRASQAVPLALTASTHVFGDETGILGDLALELGRVDTLLGLPIHNSATLWRLTHKSPSEVAAESVMSNLDASVTGFDADKLAHDLHGARARLVTLRGQLDNARPTCADADAVLLEFGWAADFLRHACDRALWMLDADTLTREELDADITNLIADYGARWHARNRAGGFADSVARMEAMRAAYAESSLQ